MRQLIMLCLFIANFCSAQQHDLIDNLTKKAIDEYYTKQIKKRKIPGGISLAIIDNGEIVYTQGYGYANREKGILADEETIYRIASCTKTFTALSLMQLQEKGQLDINQSVRKYIPELNIYNPYPNNGILLKDMMSHTAGIPSDVLNGFLADNPPDMNWLISELNKQTIISPEQYFPAYSNPAYGLLGEVISRVSGNKYGKYIKENIFKLLNMHSSYIHKPDELMTETATGYVDKKKIDEPAIRDVGASMIHSNVIDMANFVTTFLGNGKFENSQVFSEDIMRELQKNRHGGLKLRNIENEQYGYGIGTRSFNAIENKDTTLIKIIGHNGATLAFSADYQYIPELKLGAVILCNSDAGRSITSGYKLLKLYAKNAKKIELEKITSLKTDNKILEEREQISFDEIKGTYTIFGTVVHVKKEDKIKFKVEGLSVVLKKKPTATFYTTRIVLLNILPIRVKEMNVKFEKLDGVVYLKIFDPTNGEEIYAGAKAKVQPISENWKKYFGEYTLSTTGHLCSECPEELDFAKANFSMSELDGFVTMDIRDAGFIGGQKMILKILSEKRAVTHGIGRQSGNTVSLLENGNVYFHGNEFSRKQ